MDERVAAAWARLPDYLSQHVALSAAALTLGILISLPLAVAATRMRRLRWPLLAGVSLVQTIPSLALLALFYPLLLGFSALTLRLAGFEFSALGFLPALLALTLYSMLPIVRNTILGFDAIDPAVLEAARAVGMTGGQTLWRVQLPLAAPAILAGIRTSAVWVIGGATLSTPIGQTSLGNYIFTGLQTENWVFVIFGCIAAAALAMSVDLALAQVEAGLARRQRVRIIGGAAAILLGAALALASFLGPAGKTYTIGAKPFSEQLILSNLIIDSLSAHGLPARARVGLGSSVVLRALAKNEIDAYVDYSGTIWANSMGRTDNPGRDVIRQAVTTWLLKTHGVRVLGGLGFENAYALAMRRERANALGIRSLADLAAPAPRLSIGADYEFFSRPEWAAVRSAYGLRFQAERQFQPLFLYRALAQKDVDVIAAYSSDGRIAVDRLLVLADPKGAIPPYDALILLSPRIAKDSAFKAALFPLLGAIPVETMREANEMVDRADDKRTPEAAAAWLSRKLNAER